MATKVGRAQGALCSARFRANPRVGGMVVESRETKAILTLLALKVEREARRRAPVDTGRLRNSITHRLRTTTGSNPQAIAEIGTGLEYAAAQEFGTRNGVPPTRFLGGALQYVAGQLGGTM